MRPNLRSTFLLCFCCSLIVSLPQLVATQEAPSAQKLYGTWLTYPRGNPATDPVRREFRHNSATGQDEMLVIHRCAGTYQPVVATAVSPIEVTEDTIRVLKSNTDAQSAKNKSCESSIETGTLSYTLSEEGNRLTLTNPGGNPDLLELARQDSNVEPATPKNIYGTWLMPAVSGKGSRVQTRIVFYTTADCEKVREVTICSQDNDTVVSHVDSDINIGTDQITILQSASHIQQEAGGMCKASISAGTWRYNLASDGVTMTLSMDGGKPVKLTRELPSGLD